MLLLVVDAQFDELERFGRKTRQRAFQRLVDMAAIGADLVERRPAQHPSPRPRVPGSLGLVIAVEQEGVALVERRVPKHMVAQHKGFEEPGRMGEVPFRRRGVGERLDRGVGIGQRRGQLERQLARGEELFANRLGGSGRILPGHARAPLPRNGGRVQSGVRDMFRVPAIPRAFCPASRARRRLRLTRHGGQRRKDGRTGG